MGMGKEMGEIKRGNLFSLSALLDLRVRREKEEVVGGATDVESGSVFYNVPGKKKPKYEFCFLR